MRRHYEPSAELRRLAHQQAGVVTRQQALALGAPRSGVERLVQQAHWQTIMPGIIFTHDQQPSWEALAWAGVLAGGDGSRLGGHAAAHLHGLIDDPPEVITVLIPHSRERQPRECWNFVREREGVRPGASPGSPPRTRIDEVILDLCADRFRDGPRQSVAHWVSVAVQRRLTTPARLRAALSERARLAGRAEISAVLKEVDAGSESPLELRYAKYVEKAHGLPAGRRQARFSRDGVVRRRDVRYEGYGVLVELDGLRGHNGVDRFRDFRRDNEALLAGEVTLRYGWDDTTQSACAVAAQVAEMLIRGGWSGRPTACPGCATRADPTKGGITS